LSRDELVATVLAHHPGSQALVIEPITSELGNVTPVIVVPGDWSRSAFDFHAQERDCRVGGGTRVRCCDA
jgi:hypothetical protein